VSKPLVRRVLEILHENPGLSVKELSTLLDISVERVRGLLYKLKSSGFIERAGKGYMLTERGLRFLEYLEKSKAPVHREEKPVEDTTRVHEETPQPNLPETPITRGIQVATELVHLQDSIVDLKKRVEALEKRIVELEKALRNLEKAIQAKQKRSESLVLEEPVMFYSDVVNKYGQVYIEKIISENKVKKIGALVVDNEFYKEFRAKFPIKIQDVDKLSHHEKILLDEMRREAMVVLFAGREYRLVEE